VCFYKALFGLSVTSVSQYLFLSYEKPIGLLLPLDHYSMLIHKAICMNSALILWAFDLLFFTFLAVSLPPLLFNVRITYIDHFTSRNIKITVWDRGYVRL